MARMRGFFRQPLRQLVAEFIGYTAASAVALVADLGTLTLLVSHGVYYLVAATISFLVGLVIVYLASTWWIFSWRSYEGKPRIELGFFLFTGVVGLALNLGIMYVGTALLGFYYLIPKLVSVAFVFAWNYLSRKIVLFTPDRGPVQLYE